jgi:ATP-binding cassette subfamily B protein
MRWVRRHRNRLSGRQEWRLARAVHQAAPATTVAWWLLLALRGLLPPAIAVVGGALIGAITRSEALTATLVVLGALFVLAQMVGPLHEAVGFDLGARTSTALNDRLLAATTAPDGIAHLERSDLADDLATARDLELGSTTVPLTYAVNFIGDDLVPLISGVVSAVVLAVIGWWQALLLVVAWGSTHWLLRESSVWSERRTPEVQRAQRHSTYAYALAVDPPAAKEVRLFGLTDWVLDRFVRHRRRLYELQYEATRLRERPTAICLVVVTATNLLVFVTLARQAIGGDLTLASTLVATQTAIGVSGLAFGGLNWALDGAAAPVAAIDRLERSMPEAGALARTGTQPPPAAGRGPQIEVRDLHFGYPGGPTVLDGVNLTIPAGTSLAIVGQNGAGKTTLAKLLCRFYDPTSGLITIDGADLRDLDLPAWRARLAAVFQDYLRLELPLRDNIAAGATGDPATSSDEQIRAALAEAGGTGLATHGVDLDTVLAKGYPGGTDLSGGQWQRVALARALHAVHGGAALVLLDEPTAQLDVRGEAEIFDRVLRATRGCTTILVSHRFSTVRRADRICVLEHGRVIEFGTHGELIALGGRYRTMFDLQASRFVELDDEGKELTYDRLD